MTKEIWIGIILTAAIAAGVAYYYGLWPQPQPPPPAPATTPAPQPRPPPAAAPIQHPVPGASAPATPLPGLDDSDGRFRAELAELYGEPPVVAHLVPRNVIVRLVATIDSLDRAEPVAMKTRAIPAVGEALVLERAGGKVYLSDKNAVRYQPLITALEAVDGKAVAELYLRWYPLFQQAYVELGYPQAYFNDRLIEIIDHLLATPDLKGPHLLVRPTVAWRFADPQLERMSSGQKILLRLGLDQAGVVKGKLREIRAVVAQQQLEPA